SRVAVARAYSSPRRVRVTSLRDAVARRLFAVVGLSGVEPLTSRLSGVRSNHLSYRPMEDFGIRIVDFGFRKRSKSRQSKIRHALYVIQRTRIILECGLAISDFSIRNRQSEIR